MKKAIQKIKISLRFEPAIHAFVTNKRDVTLYFIEQTKKNIISETVIS
jgi:hypothetical protein